jgi:hypothetical protein
MLLAASTSLAAAEGPAIGQFELKTLESAQGSAEFQSQNAYTWGEPRRGLHIEGEDDEEEELYDENTVVKQRHALEMELGFSRYLKSRVGIEFEKERLDEPGSPSEAQDYSDLKLTEFGAELIAILVPRDGDGFGLGVVVEFERPILSAAGESNSLVMGPILEFAQGPWQASFVPMAVHAFGGDQEVGEDGVEPRDNKWDFAYAAQLAYTVSDALKLTIEGYGTVDRLGSSGHRSEASEHFGDHDQHRAGPIVYWSTPLEAAADDDEGAELTIGAGVLFGLTEHTPDGTFKLSAEVDF